MRHAIAPTLACITLGLIAGCGSDTVPQAPPPAGPAPAPTAPAPAAPAPRASTTAATPVLLDLASPALLARLKSNGQEDATPRVVDEPGGGRSLEFACQAGAAWPGLNILPESGSWDLSASAGIEVVVANSGASMTQIGIRIDQVGGSGDQWNGEGGRLAPGASATFRVYFGQSWGKPAHKLDTAHVSRVQVYAVKPADGCLLRIRSCAAFGKAGDKPAAGVPKASNTKRTPSDGAVLCFAGGFDPTRFQMSGTRLTAAERDGRPVACITVSKPGARTELVYRPAKALDLRDFSQATFVVRNPGTAPLRVACRLNGSSADDRVVTEADIAPGQRSEIVVPFASGQVWQGVSPGAKAPAPADKPFLGAPKEQSSVGLVSDAVSTVALTILDPAAGLTVEWEGVTASAGGPAILPDWIGTRPPVDGDWVRIYSDEFDGTALDTTHWTPRLPWIGPIPYELQRYNDKNVSVGGGLLTIHCEKKTGHLYDNPQWPARDYTTGAVTSYPKWRMLYGYTEARMKLPKALGLWPGFWTMPDRGPLPSAETGKGAPPADWQADWEAARGTADKNRRRSTEVDGMEFDIMEHCTRFGPFRYNIAAHWDGYGKDHKSTGTSRIYSQPDKDGYIVAGLLWEPGRLTWFCNGRPVGTWADPRVASVPASLKFTVQMGGWAGNEVDDSALPADFQIDWVRVWQLRERLPAARP